MLKKKMLFLVLFILNINRGHNVKICMFTPGWLPAHEGIGAGGIEVYVKQLVSGLVKRGHEVSIITTRHPEGVKHEKFRGLNIYYAGNFPFKYNSSYFEESLEIFEKIHRENKFDLIHTQDYVGYGYYKKYGHEIPSVTTAHGTPLNMIKSVLKVKNPKSIPQIPHWIKYHFNGAPKIFNNSDKIICVSKELCNDIIDQYNISNSKISQVFHGIDTGLFKPEVSSIKTELCGNNEKIILYVGGLQKLKGIHIIIEAFQGILTKENSKLVIIGDGPYLNNLKRISTQLNVRNKVIFIGRVSNQALPDYYNAADVVVIPSIIIESAGLVVLEAMSTGRPVIASRVGGIPTAIEHFKNGILVEPGNSHDLNEKILEVLQNRELAENLGQAGREKVLKQFSLDRMIEQTLKIYEECRN
jgi:glycogen synthase